MKKALAGLLFLGLIGCDGINASYQDNNAPAAKPPPVAQKPTQCKMDFAKTCWSETIDRITKCIKDSESSDVFSANQEFCSNASGKLVSFASPADIFVRPFDAVHTPIEFRVLPDRINECFRVRGTANNFEIVFSQTGEKVFLDLNDQQLTFSCLDGQKVSVANKDLNNCQLGSSGFIKGVPGIEFGTFKEDGVEQGWSFRFRGAAGSPDVFKCYYP